MTRTLNLMFRRLEDHLTAIEALQKGSIQRTAQLEKLVTDVPLFLVMAADLAVMVEDLTMPPSVAHHGPPPAPQNDDEPTNGADGKGMYL